MSTEPETTRVVRSWLEDGVTVLPDRVLDAVLDQLPATPQRRATWPARRLPEMHSAIKLALGAAAVVAVSLLGLSLLGGGGAPSIGGASPAPPSSPAASPSPAPSPDPDPTPPPVAANGTAVPAGEYYMPITSTARAVVTVPDGMIGEGWAITNGQEPPFGSSLSFWTVANITVDPCAAEWLVPPVGESVDELVAALAERPDFVEGSIEPTTINGHQGRRLVLAVPDDLDFETCASGRYIDWLNSSDGGLRWSQGPGQLEELFIVDVDGQRVVLDISSFPDTPTEDLARIRSIVDSIRFETP